LQENVVKVMSQRVQDSRTHQEAERVAVLIATNTDTHLKYGFRMLICVSEWMVPICSDLVAALSA
jgi:hypothetical protein